MTHNKTNDPLWIMLGGVIIILIMLLLSGCATAPGATASLKPVCTALGPPHQYNSHNKDSAWHAGPLVVKRLRRDNYVGTHLPCPGY